MSPHGLLEGNYPPPESMLREAREFSQREKLRERFYTASTDCWYRRQRNAWPLLNVQNHPTAESGEIRCSRPDGVQGRAFLQVHQPRLESGFLS